MPYSARMRRAAVSIPSNIAEGKRRGSRPEFRRFLQISFGSGAEIETQMIIAKRIFKISPAEYKKTDDLLKEVMKMLNRMVCLMG